jgi:regulator of sirC expression with transglutaminase-like and TPR domain
MRKYFILLGFVLISLPLYPQGTRYTGQTIEDILQQPDGKIDLGIACLVLAKDAYPPLNISRFDYIIDYMVDRIRVYSKGVTDPSARIGLLNSYLFRPGPWNDSITFTYNLDDLGADSTKDQFLNGYIATKQGSCITMSMLYLVVADRLGWPIKPVRSPKHIFCRYIKKGFKYSNIEATCGGGWIPNEDYIRQVNIPPKSVKNGVYLRTLTKKEYIATLLGTNVRYYSEKRKDFVKAEYYSKLAISLDSTLSSAYWNLGELYRNRAIELDSLRYEKIQELKRENAFPLRSYAHQGAAGDSIPDVSSHSKTMDEQISNMKTGGFNSVSERSNPNSQQALMSQNIRRENDEGTLMAEIRDVDDEYGKHILALVDQSHKLKSKAKALGIILKFPEAFFIKQAESIEKFKRTGKY